jgi:hypothetical protein
MFAHLVDAGGADWKKKCASRVDRCANGPARELSARFFARRVFFLPISAAGVN